jgi:hypothetical protein
MKKTEIRNITFALVFGLLLGSYGFGIATAEETPSATAASVGEVIAVCIDKKTGVIRAAATCKKTERKTVLGGAGAQGPKGDKGDIGAQGPQGLQGERGLVGSSGSVSGLRTQVIPVLKRYYGSDTCLSGISGPSLLNGDTSLRTFGTTISLTKACTSFTESNVTVYVP